MLSLSQRMVRALGMVLVSGAVAVRSAEPACSRLVDLSLCLPDEPPVQIRGSPADGYEWTLPDGLPQTLRLNLPAQGIDPAAFDEIRFEIQPQGSLVGLHTRLLGFPGVSDVSSWYLKIPTPVGAWAEGHLDLRVDDDGIYLGPPPAGSRPGTLVLTLSRRVLGVAGEPLGRTARLRRLRLVRQPVAIRVDLAEMQSADTAQELATIYPVRLREQMGVARTVRLEADSRQTLRHFRAEGPGSVALGPGEEKVVAIRLTLARQAADALGALYAESALPRVWVEGVDDSDAVPLQGYRPWPLWGVVPVSRRWHWTPATLQATVAARERLWPAVSAWRADVVKRAEQAGQAAWPLPHGILPGHTMGYRCNDCRGYLRPAAPGDFTRHRCPTCGRVVENDETATRAYVGRYYNDYAQAVRTCALAYLLNGEERHARRAADLLTRLAQAYADLPVAGRRSTSGGSHLACNTLLGSYVLPVLAEGYEFLQGTTALDPAANEAVRACLLAEALAIARHNTEYTNQTAEHLRAFGTVGLVAGFWPLAAEAVHGPTGWHAMVEYAYSEDGIGHEAGAYHRAIFGAMNAFAEFAVDRGVDLYTPRFKRVFDGSLTLGVTQVSYELAYRAYRDPTYLPVLAQQRERLSESAVLHGEPGLPELAETPVASVHLPGAGYLILRRGTAAGFNDVRLNYGKTFDRSERDRLSTFFFRSGQALDSSAGRIIYSSPRAEWMYATAAHNAIVIDGGDERDVEGRLLAFNPASQSPAAAVESRPEAPLYPGVRHVRAIALVGAAFVVLDHVTAEGPRVIDRYQHGVGTAAMVPPLAPVTSEVPALPAAGGFTGLQSASCAAEWCLTFANGLRLRLLCDRPFTAYRADTVGGWQAEPREVTFARVQAAEVTFAAAFVMGPEADLPTLDLGSTAPGVLAVRIGEGPAAVRLTVDPVRGSARVDPAAP